LFNGSNKSHQHLFQQILELVYGRGFKKDAQPQVATRAEKISLKVSLESMPVKEYGG
jgi:hypothetical protein